MADDADRAELVDKLRALTKRKHGDAGTWRELFASYDRNGDGAIDGDELDQLLTDADVGNAFTRGAWIKGVIEALDTSSNGTISRDELAAAIATAEPPPASPPPAREPLPTDPAKALPLIAAKLQRLAQARGLRTLAALIRQYAPPANPTALNAPSLRALLKDADAGEGDADEMYRQLAMIDANSDGWVSVVELEAGLRFSSALATRAPSPRPSAPGDGGSALPVVLGIAAAWWLVRGR